MLEYRRIPVDDALAALGLCPRVTSLRAHGGRCVLTVDTVLGSSTLDQLVDDVCGALGEASDVVNERPAAGRVFWFTVPEHDAFVLLEWSEDGLSERWFSTLSNGACVVTEVPTGEQDAVDSWPSGGLHRQLGRDPNLAHPQALATVCQSERAQVASHRTEADAVAHLRNWIRLLSNWMWHQAPSGPAPEPGLLSWALQQTTRLGVEALLGLGPARAALTRRVPLAEQAGLPLAPTSSPAHIGGFRGRSHEAVDRLRAFAAGALELTEAEPDGENG